MIDYIPLDESYTRQIMLDSLENFECKLKDCWICERIKQINKLTIIWNKLEGTNYELY